MHEFPPPHPTLKKNQVDPGEELSRTAVNEIKVKETSRAHPLHVAEGRPCKYPCCEQVPE